MKKLILTACVFVLGTTAFANNNMTLGVQLGGVLGNLSTDSGAAYTSKFGIMGGLSLDWQLSDSLYLTPELMYVQKGAKVTVLSIEASAKYSYIEVPVLLKAKFDASPEFKPYVMAGPSLGILMSASSTVGTAAATDIKSATNSTDFGLNIGGGFEYWASQTWALYFNTRYYLGLSDISTASTKDKTRGLYFLAGVNFVI